MSIYKKKRGGAGFLDLDFTQSESSWGDNVWKEELKGQTSQ